MKKVIGHFSGNYGIGEPFVFQSKDNSLSHYQAGHPCHYYYLSGRVGRLMMNMLLLENKNSHKLFMKFGYIMCIAAFIIWLINAIEKFKALPTSSKVSFKYGDEGDKLLRFPIVTLCKDLQKGYYETPYFLNYIESCLTEGQSVEELVKKVSCISNLDFITNYICDTCLIIHCTAQGSSQLLVTI